MIITASGRLRSSDSERLPRFVETNSAENSPDALTDCRLWRVMSPPSGSILITSAPWSARNIVANGPETTLVRSSTLIPANGPGMSATSGFVSSTYIGAVSAATRSPFEEQIAIFRLTRIFSFRSKLRYSKCHLKTYKERDDGRKREWRSSPAGRRRRRDWRRSGAAIRRWGLFYLRGAARRREVSEPRSGALRAGGGGAGTR